MSKMLLKILQMLLFLNYGVSNIFSFGFIEALDLKGTLNSLKEGTTSAKEYADQTVFTFARAMVQIKQLVLIK